MPEAIEAPVVDSAPAPEVDVQTYIEQRRAELKAEVETPVVAADADDEDDAPEAPAEKDTESTKIKAWKDEDEDEDLPEDKPDHVVPVKKVIELRKKAQDAKAQLESVRTQTASELAELARYREREAVLQNARIDSELEQYSVASLANQTFSSWEEYQAKVLEYQSKRDALLQEKSVTEWERRNQAAIAQREQAKQVEEVQQRNTDLISTFNAKAATAAKANPEIAEAVSYFRAHATKVPDAVLGAIMDEDLAPEIVYEILTDKKHIEVIYGKDPVKSVKLVAKLAAQVEAAKAPARAAKVVEEPDTDAVPLALPRREASIPKTVTGRSSNATRTVDYDSDMATFLRQRRAEERNRRR